jgi:hypothetical protein
MTSEIFMPDTHSGILYGIGVDNRQYVGVIGVEELLSFGRGLINQSRGLPLIKGC